RRPSAAPLLSLPLHDALPICCTEDRRRHRRSHLPFPPAGATDLVTRLVAGKVAADSGWNFVIDNRPGASGNIGLNAVAKARAGVDLKSTRLNSSHQITSYAVL